MKQVTTYVGIDARKKDLLIAMLVGHRTAPVTWQVANEPQAVRRLLWIESLTWAAHAPSAWVVDD